MAVRGRIGLCAIAAGAFLVSQPGPTWAETASATPKQTSQDGALQHDGQHDFDFLVGSWKIHLKRLLRPLTGSNEWVEFDGTVVCRKIWNGRGEVEEFNADSPEKHIHIQGLALRLYNPESHQWSIYWADTAKGALGGPPVVGQFKNGRGEFFDQEEFKGRAIFTRYVWSDITTNTPHFEQSFSDDGGKTWETNWITYQTKEKL